MDLSEATIVHEKPALVQELNWLPMRFSTNDTDPVEKVTFTFWNGQLYRMVVNYAGTKTTGLTSQDMIAALSVKFGEPAYVGGTVTLGQSPSSEQAEDQVKLLASWRDDASSIDLVQSPYNSDYQLQILSKRLDAIAQTALIQGRRLDALEAPEREKSQEQDAQRELAKSRVLNKGNFRP